MEEGWAFCRCKFKVPLDEQHIDQEQAANKNRKKVGGKHCSKHLSINYTETTR